MKFRYLLALVLVSLIFSGGVSNAKDTPEEVKVTDEVIYVEGFGKVTMRNIDYGTHQTSYLLSTEGKEITEAQLDTLDQMQAAKVQPVLPEPKDIVVDVSRTGLQYSPDGKVKSFTELKVRRTTSIATLRFKVTKAYSSILWLGGGNANTLSMTNQVCFEGTSITISLPPGIAATNTCGNLGPFIFPNTLYANQTAAGHEASGSAIVPSLSAVRQTDVNTAIKLDSAITAISSARITMY